MPVGLNNPEKNYRTRVGVGGVSRRGCDNAGDATDAEFTCQNKKRRRKEKKKM